MLHQRSISGTCVHVTKNKEIILRGYRNFQDGLWDIPMAGVNRQSNKINVIIRKNTQMEKLANYLHACAGSTTLTTFQTANKKGNF